MHNPITAIQFEFVLLGRHLSQLRGGSRRVAGTLDSSAYTILTCIDSGGPQTIAELTEILGLDTSTVNRQTAALVRAGLATRLPRAPGKTARAFHMTALGAARLREEREASEAALNKVLAEWSPADRTAFADYLTRCNEALEYRFQSPWPRSPREPNTGGTSADAPHQRQ